MKVPFISPAHENNMSKDTGLSSDYRFKKVMTFKDFRGFKKIENIKERYKIGKVLGEGSFG